MLGGLFWKPYPNPPVSDRITRHGLSLLPPTLPGESFQLTRTMNKNIELLRKKNDLKLCQTCFDSDGDVDDSLICKTATPLHVVFIHEV